MRRWGWAAGVTEVQSDLWTLSVIEDVMDM